MKKYLKLQAKKSMSLFLAVLMLLSCWVWMAPEKAEAAEVTPLTQYTVKIVVNFENPCDGGHVTNNGTTVVSSYPSAFKAEGDQTLTYTTTSFPTTIFMRFTTNSWSTSKGTIKSISINDHVVQSGGWSFDTTKLFSSGNDDFTFTRSSDTSTNMGGTVDWPMPKTAGFVDSTASGTAQSMSINKIGGAEVNKATSFNYGTLYDQYGVKMSSGNVSDIATKSVWISKTPTGEDLGDSNIYYDATKGVVAKPELQLTQVPDANGKFECYLIESYTGKNIEGGEVNSKVSAKYTITFPKYDVVFDAVLDGAEIKDASGTLGTKSYTASNYHGKDISVPTTAEKSGYTFKGFWSKPQPTTGDASYNALEANFANPCSSEDYASYKAAAGSTENNGIVTDADGNKWYDAGKALVPADVKTIDVSENYANFAEKWHGWWISDDIKIKFYDVDGKFKGEQVVKSGQTYGAITWPTSSYSTYTSGAFTFTVDPNIWVTTDGTEINKNSGTFTKNLILTPKLTRTEFKDKYTITFMNPNGGSVAVGTDGRYDYRANIKTYADTAKGKIAATPNDVSSDLEFRYELLGWSSVVPTTGKNYHVLLENADFDVNGTAIGLNSDWVVRNDATYYPVYRRFTKSYVVEFHYKDATGANATRQLKFKYGETLVPPTEYVPYSYVVKGFGYTFNKWSYSNADGDATLDYNATIPFTNEYISIEGAALDGIEGLDPIDITATYGAPVATPYTVKFDYIDSKGEEASSSVQVRNEQFILQDTVGNLAPAEKWENEDQLYTYANKWEITDGAAVLDKNDNGTIDGEEKTVGAVLDTADLIYLTPISNVTFKAVYANPVPYFTVTYIDGTQSFKDRVLQGSNVPEWTYKVNNDNGTPDDTTDDFKEDKIYVPADYEGEGGTYVFQGWFDAATGGNKVTTADKVTSNLTLYSQFKFVPDTFTITFMNHDGSVQLAAGMYEKGQNIEALVTTATKAAQGRAEDNVYKYVFLGWDKAVPTFCEGYDVTYTALYKPVYKYYNAKWYNSDAVKDDKGNIIGWAANKDFTTDEEGNKNETNLFATTKHTYNSKLYSPSTAGLTCLETAPDGQKYVFAGWYYNDAEGNAVKYERGMTITANMEFYATYTLTAKVYTVTTVVKGETAKYEVADRNTVTLPQPQAGYVDDENHDAFAGWYTDEAYTTPFDADTAITADIKVYAKFEESKHDFSMEEIVKASTYFEKGSKDVWCDCDKAETKSTVELAMLQDTKAPTGTIYLGGHSWSSDGTPAYETDDLPISIYANDNTDVIITAYDEGIGVKVIRAFVFSADTVLTATNYGAAQSLAVNVFTASTDKDGKYDTVTNNANFAIKVKDLKVADLDENGDPQYDENNNVKFKSLESGKSYIVYYYVNDKATTDNGAPATGNQLNRLVRTAKFIYDDTAPVFEVTGESNDATVPTYCGSATVTGVEEDAVLTVNGEVVTATDDKYVINYAEGIDNVIITATDKAGNTFSKKIKVADHSYLTTEQAASCGVAGYKKVECIICGDVKSEVKYDALDHIWSDRQVIPADCVNNGIVVVTCEICGDKVETEFEEDGTTPVIPALGHEYAIDAEGNIIYTTVTESTCKTKGLAEAFCSRCSEGRITKELDLNPENHEDITITEVEADCVNGGYYTEACSCGVTIKSETYPATGHGNLEEGKAFWYVTVEPTCYQTGSQELRCTKCSNAITENGAVITKEIEATGEHVKTVTNPDTYKDDGFVYYHCATEDCDFEYEPKKYVDDSLQEFTVTFKEEDGTVIKTFTQLEGTAIAKDAVTASDKANSADGKYKYTFAGWKAGEKTYKLPLTVTENLELTASYKETKIMYTHIFSVPTVWTQTTAAEDTTEVYKTLVGAIDDERVPSGTPVFNATGDDANYTYTFEGWARKTDATQTIVTDFTVKGDAEFIAVFSREAITYKVIYYNGTDLVWNTTVNSGESVTFGGTAPTKAFDDDNHYAFSGKWYTDATLKTEYKGGAITAETRLYAGFTATAHSYDKGEGKGTVTQKADCLLPELTEYACACGHKITEETKEALGHDMGAYTYDENTGMMVAKCQREDCDYSESYKASVTIEFVNYNGVTLELITVERGKEVKFSKATPERAADEKYTYEFAGWQGEDGKVYEAVDTVFKADDDAVYTATYTETARTFTVKYVDNNNGYKILATYTGLEYGDLVPEAPEELEKQLVVPAFEQHGHKVFAGWNIAVGATVTGDISITPKFTTVEHTCVKVGEVGATCDEKGGIKYACECGYSYVDTDANLPALGHLLDDGTVTKEPNYKTQEDGVRTYKCTREGCDYTEDRPISGKARSIKVTVNDENGAPIEHATVRLLKDGEIVMIQTTNAAGVTIFTGLDNGNYSVYVVETDMSYNDIVVNEDGTVKNGDLVATPEKEEVDTSCKCTCHKNTFWGMIFRFFQKIIKLFTGKATCCACPSDKI